MSSNPVHAVDVLAVVSQSGPTVTFFDATSYERVGVIDVPSEPHELCFDSKRRLLYCTTTYRGGYYHDNAGRANELSVIDVDAHEVIEVLDLSPEHGPHDVTLDQNRDLLYVSVEETEERPGGVVVIDADTRKPIDRISTMAPGPHWFAITPDGRKGYAANKEAPYVSAVDLERRTLVNRIQVPGSEGLASSPDGRFVYVAAPKGDFGTTPAAKPGIRVIDTETNTIVSTLETDNVVFPVHTTSNGLVLAGELRMAEANSDSSLGGHSNGLLNVFAPHTHEIIGQVEVGKFPLTIRSAPDGRTAYVSNVVSSDVSVIDLDSLDTIAILDIDRIGEPGAHGLAYVPAPH